MRVFGDVGRSAVTILNAKIATKYIRPMKSVFQNMALTFVPSYRTVMAHEHIAWAHVFRKTISVLWTASVV
jgi:hypothetical protein